MTNLDILGPGSKTAKRLTNGMIVFFFWKCILLKLSFKKKYNKKIKLQMYVMPILPFCFIFFEGCNNVNRESFSENSHS